MYQGMTQTQEQNEIPADRLYHRKFKPESVLCCFSCQNVVTDNLAGVNKSAVSPFPYLPYLNRPHSPLFSFNINIMPINRGGHCSTGLTLYLLNITSIRASASGSTSSPILYRQQRNAANASS